MDDTNQTNPTLDQSTVPGPLPPTPPATPIAPVEDITPNKAPVAPPALESQVKDDWTLPPVPPVAPLPETPVFPTTASAPEPVFVPPQAAPLSAPTLPQATPLPTIAPEEPVIPTEKPKNKISPIVGGLVALLFVVGVAGAAYYVSNQLSTRQAVAPNAPESEPMAASSSKSYIKVCCEASGGKKYCFNASGSKSGKWVYGSCGGYDCGASKQAPILKLDWKGYRSFCSGAVGGTGVVMFQGKCESTNACIQQLVEDLPAEVTDKESGIITFEKAGWINVAFGGKEKITLEPVAGGTPIVIATDSAGINILSKILEIKTPGEQYKITLRMRDETKDAYGFRVPLDAEETKCGQSDPKYGAIADESEFIQQVESKVQMESVLPSNMQCWGDSQIGDATQDFDFNDAAIIFGYEPTNQVVGACTTMAVYKKVAGAYGTTPLTAAELMTLKVGDILGFSMKSSMDNLKGRFGVTVGNGTVTWLTGTIDATDKKLITYSNYTVATASAYLFEGQVSTTP